MTSDTIPQMLSTCKLSQMCFRVKYCGYVKLSDTSARFNTAPHSKMGF